MTSPIKTNETVNTTLTVNSGLTSVAAVATGTGTLTINNGTYLTESVQTNTFGNLAR